jgi:hypothetical protein
VFSQLSSARTNASWLYARGAFGGYCHHRPQGMQSLEDQQLLEYFKMEVPSSVDTIELRLQADSKQRAFGKIDL